MVELRQTVRDLQDTLSQRDQEISDLREQMTAMHFRVAQMSRRIYGNVTERFAAPDNQLTIPGIVPDDAVIPHSTDDDGDDDDDPGGSGQSATQSPKATTKKRGRLKIPEHIESVDQIIEPDPRDCVARDGTPFVKVREEITEKLDYVAGGFRKVRLIRPVYGLPQSNEIAVSAPPPPQVVPRGLPTDRTVAMIFSEKFDLHNPLYRQQDRCARAGIDLPRSTFGNWLAAACTMLEPITQAMQRHVLASSVLQLDDTTMPRLNPGAGKTHTGRLWGYLANDTLVIDYTDTRANEHPARFLANWQGHIVADAYSGHERLYRQGQCIHIPCMAHVRRKFFDAYKDGGDIRAAQVLPTIQQLYAIEDRCRDHPPDGRQTIRQREARPLLHYFLQQVRQLSRQDVPKSPLGRACTYTLNLTERLDRYLDVGEAPIDNNALERLWKPVALGRKNYLFAGNVAGGECLAIGYTISLSCRLAGIDVFAYLCDIFAALHTGRTDYEILTPLAWAQQQRQQALVA